MEESTTTQESVVAAIAQSKKTKLSLLSRLKDELHEREEQLAVIEISSEDENDHDTKEQKSIFEKFFSVSPAKKIRKN